MKVLLTGATGYIGSSLLPRLKGHEVYALVRKPETCHLPNVHVLKGDLLDFESLQSIPDDIDVAYYLVHSMRDSRESFQELEAKSALHFQRRLSQTKARQIIYLSGLSNEATLSPHLQSRKQVDTLLRQGTVPVTTLMAGIIIGPESASFQIIRDLVNRLPVMVAPRWVKSLVQPIAVQDVLDYLVWVLDRKECLGQRFEIGGPDILSYKDLLLKFAEIRGLHRIIFTVPVLTPHLSAYWLYFITSVNLPLASALIDSVKNNAICQEHRIETLYPKRLLSVEEAIRAALEVKSPS